MRRNKILVAAGDPELRYQLRGFLEHHGQFVECAASAHDAIRIGLTLAPALLVTELELEDDTSGLDLIQCLQRARPGLAVVVVSAEDPERLRARWPEPIPLPEFCAAPPRPAWLLERLERL